MTEVKKIQKKKIDLYSEVLNDKKRIYILQILNLFYKKFSFEDLTSSTDWLDNQIGWFLDPYGFNNKFIDKRKKYFETLNKLVDDCEYKNVSLDKIVLFLFSWEIDELKMFYKMNKSSKKGNAEKSVYNLGLRVMEQKGGGCSNEFVLYYINSLKNSSNFKKTILFFNYLNIVNKEESYFHYINKYLNLKEIYIDKFTPFIDIDKLFLYLLNVNSKEMDLIINNIKSFFIKFEAKKELFKNKIKNTNIEFSDKEWFYKKMTSKGDIAHKFYKLFDNKLVYVNILTTFNNYIRSINFLLFDTNKVSFNYNVKIYYYYYINIYEKISKIFGLGNTMKTKKIILKAKEELFTFLDKKLVDFLTNYTK